MPHALKLILLWLTVECLVGWYLLIRDDCKMKSLGIR